MEVSELNVTNFANVAEAIQACSQKGNSKLIFPAGLYESATIHLPDNIHLHFEEGAVLQAAELGFDEPEENPFDAYQDFGHSHFNNGLLVAREAKNITISGPGHITGADRLRSGDDAKSGYGGKLLVFVECQNIIIKDVTLSKGGHFTLLANGVDQLELKNIDVQGQRDGANIISCKNVCISNSSFSGHDDALVFKSDYALGKKGDTENVTVENCSMHSSCNAIQFGTETIGAFRNIRFENIHCKYAGKSAISILSCDGSVIEDISFKNVVLEECSTFFFIKIADRGRCPDYKKTQDTGIIRRISFNDVEGRGPMNIKGVEVTPTIMGLPHRAIEDIRFINVHLTVPGGHPAKDAESYVEDTGFFFSRFRNDLHPCYGWWLRDVKNISFEDCSVRFSETDGRPAVVVEDGENVTFNKFSAMRSADHKHDIRLAGQSTGVLEASNETVLIGIDSPQNNKFNAKHMYFKSYQTQKVEFSQAPFWFWNDELNCNEITRQLVDFQSHGVHGFVIHPRAGLPRHQGWMSPELLEHMRYTIDQAVARDMWVILYDEAMYPSGSSGGQVVAENPDYACRCLVQVDLTEAKVGETVQSVKVGAKGVELNNKQTLVATVNRQHDNHRLAIVDTPVGSTIRGVHFIEEDPQRRSDHKEVAENQPLAGDLLNPEAMQCFIKLVYQRYYDEFGSHFGKTIKAIFTDEPGILGRGRLKGINPRPGTTGILEHVNAFLGYDFTPHLPALWDIKEPNAQQYRDDYNRAIRHRLQETYYQPISKWCIEHGIALTGHPEASNDIGMLRHFQIPGQDVVIRFIEPEKESALVGEHSTMAKCASSAMLHLGRRFNLNEFAGAYGHQLSYKEYRWLALWLLIRGCNMLVPHAFYYSIRGPRIDERPRDVGPNSPWWDSYKGFAEMTGKLCWLNTDSQQMCNVAILCQDNRLPWLSARVCFENQIDFNYLEDYHLIKDVLIDEKGVHIANMNYEILIIEKGFGVTCGDKAKGVVEKLKKDKRVIEWDPANDEPHLSKLIFEKVKPFIEIKPQCSALRTRLLQKENTSYAIIFNEQDTVFKGCVQIEGISAGVMMNMDTNETSIWNSESEIQINAHECMVIISQH